MKTTNDEYPPGEQTSNLKCGIQDGSQNFMVANRHGLRNTESSCDWMQARLSYMYRINHRWFWAIAPLVVILGVVLGDCTWEWDISLKSYNLVFTNKNVIILIALLSVVLYGFGYLRTRPTYLVDYACYCPRSEFKVSKDKYIELARKSGNFEESTLNLQQRILQNSGIGDESYLPHQTIFQPGFKKSLNNSREEAASVIFGAIDDLFSNTCICSKDIKILILNCGMFSTTPSLTAMVMNHYKFKHNTISYNLGGMGCGAGVIAIGLARDMLAAHPGTYALVISTEIVSYTWYTGKDVDMIVPNCFLRMGAATMLLANGRNDWWRAKYRLKQVFRYQKSTNDERMQSVYLKQDAEGTQSLSISKDVIKLGAHVLKESITTPNPNPVRFSDKTKFFTPMLSHNKSKPCNTNYNLVFDHICILANSKKVLDEIQKNLDITDEYMKASRKTLERFGNTSSSSIWYELAYLEMQGKIKRGNRVWQIALGSGLKCNSVVWEAVRDVGKPNKNPWVQD
ncbi:3-ketoacyl-CoA synthase 10-like protein [Drosera capensis]